MIAQNRVPTVGFGSAIFSAAAALALVGGCVWPLQAADATPPQRYALLVAVTEYGHAEMNRAKLRFPEIDAEAMAVFLEEHGYQIDRLYGSEATRSAILDRLKGLARKGNANGAVVVGLWGHGVEFDASNESMFCPYDAVIREVTDAAGKTLFDEAGLAKQEPDPASLVTMADVLGGLRASGAGSRVLLADCCRNDPARARGRAFGRTTEKSQLPPDTIALFACSANEKAFEDPAWGHGAFTKCLLELLPSLTEGKGDDIGRIVGDLQVNVSTLVRNRTNDRDTQTINPVSNGVPRLRLLKSKPITNSLGMTLVRIPAGTFRMGSERGLPDERPVRLVRITRPFLIGQTEVTQGQFENLMGKAPWGGEADALKLSDAAASHVSWIEAVEFCRKLTERERRAGQLPPGRAYRLPTEAEWEHACRAGSTTEYSFGDDAGRLWDHGWWGGFDDGNAAGGHHAHKVAEKLPNPWSLHDMHGNVLEWCADWLGTPAAENADDPTGPSAPPRP